MEAEHEAEVTGQVVTQPGKKLVAGDRFGAEGREWVVTAEAPP